MRLPHCYQGGIVLLLAALDGSLQQAAEVRPFSVCESKTVNYITHSLAQQCLRPGRTNSAMSQPNHEQLPSPTRETLATATSSDTAERYAVAASDHNATA